MSKKSTATKRDDDAERAASVGELVAALDGGSDAGGETTDVETEGAEPVELVDALPADPEDDLSAVEGDASPRLVSIVESLLFSSNRPLSVRDIRKILKEPSARQVQLALKHIGRELEDRGMVLRQVAGGFRLQTNPKNASWVQRMLMAKPARLSRAQLEALAVVAYRQPITKAEIDAVRGVDCTAVLKLLLDRDIVQVVGRKEEPGRPLLYGTTVRFLEFFNLKSLRDMPELREVEELTEETKATLRDRLGDDEAEAVEEAMGQGVLELQSDGTPTDEDAGDGEAADDEAADDDLTDDADPADAVGE